MLDVGASAHAALVSAPRPEVLAPLASAAWQLEAPWPHERRGILRNEAGLLLDGLLVRVARGRGALDIAIGEGLAALSIGDRLMRLGFSGLGDYARERLGIAGSTPEKMARLARKLRERPLLRDAVRRGDVSARKAETVLPVARGEDEARWVERARSETVRALAAAVKAASGAEPEQEEPWEHVVVELSPEQRARVDEAMALAGRVLGASAPRWQRLEVICQEYLGEHPTDPDDDAANDTLCHGPVPDWLESARKALEEETERWVFLEKVEPFEAPSGPDGEDGADALVIDERLRELGAMRAGWDALVGHLAMLVKTLGLWRDMCFTDFGHYAAERLGVARRTVEQRVALERRLYTLPALRTALAEGRISYEKARLVADHADDTNVDAWIARARAVPCVALRREMEDEADAAGAQMCARPALDLRMPESVVLLLSAALHAADEAAEGWIPSGELLARVADHFVATWKPALPRRKTPAHRALERDRGLCLVPGCSRAADHGHHVQFRSRGGADDDDNLSSICAVHHLRGIHGGHLRARGRAPDALEWELTARPGVPFCA